MLLKRLLQFLPWGFLVVLAVKVESREDRLAGCKELPPLTNKADRFSWDNSSYDDLGSSNFTLADDDVEAALYLGMSGAGISTLTRVIVGDLEQMEVMRLPGTEIKVITDLSPANNIQHDARSKTLIPTRHTQDGYVIYDCPSFKGSRGPMSDILANLNLMKLTQHLRRIKLVFVVRESDLLNEGHTPFDDFLDHVITFVPSLHRYKMSFAIVISRATPFHFDDPAPRERWEVIKKATGYLHNYLSVTRKIALEAGFGSAKLREIAKINFTEWILETTVNGQGEEEFFRIGVSFELKKCGKLSNDSTAIRTRTEMRKMLTSMSYTNREPSDFGYALKAETVQTIDQSFNKNEVAFGTSLLLNMTDLASEAMGRIIHKQVSAEETNAILDILHNMSRCLHGRAHNTLPPAECLEPLLKLAKVSDAIVDDFWRKVNKTNEVLTFYNELTRSSRFHLSTRNRWDRLLASQEKSILSLTQLCDRRINDVTDNGVGVGVPLTLGVVGTIIFIAGIICLTRCRVVTVRPDPSFRVPTSSKVETIRRELQDLGLLLTTLQFDIDHHKILGDGFFGIVYGATVNGQKAAVKVLHDDRDLNGQALLDFVSEIKLFVKLESHENIVSCLGYWFDASSTFLTNIKLFVEFCSNGSLDVYLREHKSLFGGDLREEHLIRWSYQIANGMTYLASQNIVHGDLAARNVLLSDDLLAKISDFGLSINLYTSNYCTRKGEMSLPWRWMSPETLESMKFSSASDVWAYGVTLYEIFSLGRIPYPGLSYTSAFIDQLIVSGLRPGRPTHASDYVNDSVIQPCWRLMALQRPTFADILHILRPVHSAVALNDDNYEHLY